MNRMRNLLTVVVLLAGPAPAFAQVEVFRFDASRVSVGKVCVESLDQAARESFQKKCPRSSPGRSSCAARRCVLALLGSIAAQLLLARLHDRQFRRLGVV